MVIDEALTVIAFLLLALLLFKDMSGKDELKRICNELRRIREQLERIGDESERRKRDEH